MGALFGAVSALYDKFLLAPVETGGLGIDRMVVQSYFLFYQFALMLLVSAVSCFAVSHSLRPKVALTSFQWRWSIPLISLFLSAADFAYFYALTQPDAMISVVSMIRRGSVIVSFFVGALVFHEKNVRSKVIDLILVLLSMVFLWLGSQ